MSRFSRPHAAYPGEWVFVLGAKLVAAGPVYERRRMKRTELSKEDLEDIMDDFNDSLKEGATFTGTSRLHITLSGTGTGLTIPTGGPLVGGGSDGDNHSSPGESTGYSKPTSTEEATLDGRTSLPGGTNGAVTESRRVNSAAIAGGVVGAFLFVGLLMGLFVFRKRIRQRIQNKKYNRMGGSSPEPLLATPYIETKPSMAERFHVGALFGPKSNTKSSNVVAPVNPALIRQSSTTSRRNTRYVRQSLLHGQGAASPDPDEETYSPGFPSTAQMGTFYNSPSPTVVNGHPRSNSPPNRRLSRVLTDRFPIATSTNSNNRSSISCQSSAHSSINSSPTLAGEGGFFHSQPNPKLSLQAPQPVAVVPAFLSQRTATSHAPQTQPLSLQSAARVSVADSDRSWVDNRTERLEMQRRGESVSRVSQFSVPATPAEFKQHHGNPVSYGARGS